MRRRFARQVGVLVAIVGALGARSALAADRPCSPMAVDADARVRGLWPAAAEHVREAFDARDDIDTCARVRLRIGGASDAAIVVQVILPDGRAASRAVARREDVVPTLEALLLVPRQPEAESASGSFEPPVEIQVEVPGASTGPTSSLPGIGLQGVQASGTPPVPERDVLTRVPQAVPGRLGIELSVATGARIGDGQASVGVGALSFLDIRGWLIGFEGRLDRYQGIGGDSGSQAPRDMAALELAALGGRRFRFGTLALDLVTGPALALQGASRTTVARVATNTPTPTGSVTTDTLTSTSNSAVPRLVAGARLSFRARSVLRPFLGFDAEIDPLAPFVDNNDPGNVLHRLPVWTVGLALGATVGTP